MVKRKAAAEEKTYGVHYTPVDLANFLAHVTRDACEFAAEPIRVLDPACGDGVLLQAMAETFPSNLRGRLALHGYERSDDALAKATTRLRGLGAGSVELKRGDFLRRFAATESAGCSGDFAMGNACRVPASDRFVPTDPHAAADGFDIVIANPPYVRTQVLGAKLSRELAKRFGLTGRIDLYHAFVRVMTDALRDGGVLGLLTSNRFLSTQSGATLRRILTAEFQLRSVIDLGDTKLFGAAVLPAIVVGVKGKPSSADCHFHRVYQADTRGKAEDEAAPVYDSVLAALMASAEGPFRTPQRAYAVEKGVLWTTSDDAVWRLSTPTSRRWLRQIERQRACTFDDVARVCVGIKTTADRVFVRDDWESVPADCRPERELLRPLLTHHDAGRWVARPRSVRRQVLYPHRQVDGAKTVVDVAQYPRCARYFAMHRQQLEARKYVTDAGRHWYEIWVAHNPADWPRLKIVFPDISVEPRFFLDATGAVVQGDCYWITARPNQHSDWLYLMLAVANSSLITKFYDAVFHNKLYSGRRRFMTQYVRQFPLPDLSSPPAREIIRLTKALVRDGDRRDGDRRDGDRRDGDRRVGDRRVGDRRVARQESVLNELVWQAFGLQNGADS